MPATPLTCGQAIFTSVRTPMGEGYRIIAASRSVGPQEKQTITRYSPSHDALCMSASDANAADRPVAGAAFYTLSSERLCVALTCYAGTEHTGRGGQRVYTHNVVFARSDFQECGYNPFNVLRAMIRAGVATPQLKPPPVLEELQLLLDVSPDETSSVMCVGARTLSHTCPSAPFRRYVLQGLLDGRSLVVKLDSGWLESAEAWLMGVPGPMRWELSFGAGLKFSVGRRHRLQLLSDDTRTVKGRLAGQPLEYVDPTIMEGKDDPCPPVRSSVWLSFVDRHWSMGDVAALGRRTSRPFHDTGPEARERIARLYNSIDAIPDVATSVLLTQVLDLLPVTRDHKSSPLVDDAERGIQDEFRGAVQGALKARFASAPWAELAPHWPTIVSIRRSGDSVVSAPRLDRDRAADAGVFTGPLIEQLLRTAMKDDPLASAEAALDVASPLVGDDAPGNLPPADPDPGHLALLDEVLSCLAASAERIAESEPERLLQVCDRWRQVRPRACVIDEIRRRIPTVAAGSPGSSSLSARPETL